jgi:hypothetical protein
VVGGVGRVEAVGKRRGPVHVAEEGRIVGLIELTGEHALAHRGHAYKRT